MCRVSYAANKKIMNVLDLGTIIKTQENKKHSQILYFIFQNSRTILEEPLI